MHAVVARVTINDVERAIQTLHEQVIPQVSQAPGFTAGYWTRKDNNGLGMMIVESEEQARQLAEQVKANVPPDVTLDDVEIREVVGNA